MVGRLLFDKYDSDGSGTVPFWEFVNQFLPPDKDYNWRDYSSMGRVGFARVHPDLRVHKMVDILSNEVNDCALLPWLCAVTHGCAAM